VKVWTWWGRDPSSPADLVFTVVVADRPAFNAVRARLRPPKPDRSCTPVRADPEAHADLLAAPGRVFWCDPDLLPDDGWHDEDALEHFRPNATARALRAGRSVVPVHRWGRTRPDARRPGDVG
jgi:hypothetical protein